MFRKLISKNEEINFLKNGNFSDGISVLPKLVEINVIKLEEFSEQEKQVYEKAKKEIDEIKSLLKNIKGQDKKSCPYMTEFKTKKGYCFKRFDDAEINHEFTTHSHKILISKEDFVWEIEVIFDGDFKKFRNDVNITKYHHLTTNGNLEQIKEAFESTKNLFPAPQIHNFYMRPLIQNNRSFFKWIEKISSLKLKGSFIELEDGGFGIGFMPPQLTEVKVTKIINDIKKIYPLSKISKINHDHEFMIKYHKIELPFILTAIQKIKIKNNMLSLLPEEILFEICNFLTKESLKNLMITSNFFKQTLSHHKNATEQLIRNNIQINNFNSRKFYNNENKVCRFQVYRNFLIIVKEQLIQVWDMNIGQPCWHIIYEAKVKHRDANFLQFKYGNQDEKSILNTLHSYAFGETYAKYNKIINIRNSDDPRLRKIEVLDIYNGKLLYCCDVPLYDRSCLNEENLIIKFNDGNISYLNLINLKLTDKHNSAFPQLANGLLLATAMHIIDWYDFLEINILDRYNDVVNHIRLDNRIYSINLVAHILICALQVDKKNEPDVIIIDVFSGNKIAEFKVYELRPELLHIETISMVSNSNYIFRLHHTGLISAFDFKNNKLHIFFDKECQIYDSKDRLYNSNSLFLKDNHLLIYSLFSRESIRIIDIKQMKQVHELFICDDPKKNSVWKNNCLFFNNGRGAIEVLDYKKNIKNENKTVHSIYKNKML